MPALVAALRPAGVFLVLNKECAPLAGSTEDEVLATVDATGVEADAAAVTSGRRSDLAAVENGVTTMDALVGVTTSLSNVCCECEAPRPSITRALLPTSIFIVAAATLPHRRFRNSQCRTCL